MLFHLESQRGGSVVKKLLFSIFVTASLTFASYAPSAKADHLMVLNDDFTHSMNLGQCTGAPVYCWINHASLMFLAEYIGISLTVKSSCWKPGFNWAVRVTNNADRSIGTFKMTYTTPTDRSRLFWSYPHYKLGSEEIYIHMTGKPTPTKSCIESMYQYVYFGPNSDH